MKKLLTRIVGATLGLALAIGVSVGVANNREVKAAFATDYLYSATTYSNGNLTGTGTTWTGNDVGGTSFVVLKSGASLTSNGFTGLDLSKTIAFTINTRTYGGASYKTSVVRAYSDANFENDITGTPASVNATSNSLADKTANLTFANNANASTVYFKITSTTTSASNGPGIKGVSFAYANDFGDLDHIKIATQASKKDFEVGDVFSSSGLVLTGYDGANEATANTQTYSSGFTTDYDGHTFAPSDKGNGKTVTVTYSGKTATYSINVTGGDLLLNYDNSPFGTATSASENAATVTIGGIQYENKYGYNYSTNKSIEFSKSTDAYLGNKTGYANDINKIVINWQKYNNSSEIDVYACESSLSIVGATEIEPSDDGLTSTYTFNPEIIFFKICVNSDAHFMEFRNIVVFFGGLHPEIDVVSAEIANKTYYVGTQMVASDFAVTVTWTNGKAATHPTEGFTWTVNGVTNGLLEEKSNNKVRVIYKGIQSTEYDVVGSPAAAKDVISSTLKTGTSLSYSYHASDNIVTDTLNRALTGLKDTDGYTAWSDKTDASDAVYSGNSYGKETNAIQLKSADSISGIVTTTSGGKAVKVTVAWNGSTASGRTIDIYGKHSAYTSAANLYNDSLKGTKIGSIAYGTSTILNISDDYEYIGIRSNSGALYLDSIVIDWVESYSYTYSNVGIRFKGSISESLWTRLNTESTIEGFGFMLAVTDLGSDTIQYWYDEAKDGHTIDEAIATLTDEGSPIVKNFYKEVGANKPVKVDNNYGWNLFKNVPDGKANLTVAYTAVAYIRTTNDGLVFLQEETKSAADVAKDMVTADANFDAENSLNGSLNYLASLAA